MKKGTYEPDVIHERSIPRSIASHVMALRTGIIHHGNAIVVRV